MEFGRANAAADDETFANPLHYLKITNLKFNNPTTATSF